MAGLTERANEKLNRFMQTKGLGDNYQVLVCAGLNGVTFAASDPSYLNVNSQIEATSRRPSPAW